MWLFFWGELLNDNFVFKPKLNLAYYNERNIHISSCNDFSKLRYTYTIWKSDMFLVSVFSMYSMLEAAAMYQGTNIYITKATAENLCSEICISFTCNLL